MSTRLPLLTYCLLAALPALAAPVTNDDVIRMSKAGVSDTLIIQTIERSEAVFDTAPDGIIRLKQGGVSDPVIQRMLNAKPGASTPAPAALTAPAPQAASPCRDCAVIESVREVERAGQAGGTGAVAGGVAGAVIGRGVSNNRNRTFGTIAGAVGGAVAGHQIEKAVKTSKHWETVLRMEDGTTRVLAQDAQPVWRAGERVRYANGAIQPL